MRRMDCRQPLGRLVQVQLDHLGGAGADEEQLAITDLMGGKVKLTGQFNLQDTDENVYQVTLDKKINPQPEYVLGTYFYHMDGMPVPHPPPFATLLSARKTAPKGGQTEFASTYAAYEGLPETEKAALEGLTRAAAVELPIDEREGDHVREEGRRPQRPRPARAVTRSHALTPLLVPIGRRRCARGTIRQQARRPDGLTDIITHCAMRAQIAQSVEQRIRNA